MANARRPVSGRKKSGGPARKREAPPRPREAKYDSLPREDRLPPQSGPGVAAVFKTIVVRDERGQIVSVTKVAPDAKYGVGVQTQPGQTVKEYAAGTLAEDPFAQPQKASERGRRTEGRKKK